MKGMNKSDNTAREELYVEISGYVQGVGFRYFVVRHAQELGVRGYTRNESHGSVVVVAQGSRPTLERLLLLLRRGPSEAEVSNINVEWRQTTEQFTGFHIRY